MTTANRSTVLIQSGHCQTTLSGVRTMKIARTMSWNRKQPSPGPRSGSRSSPLYWTGLALIVTSGKGMARGPRTPGGRRAEAGLHATGDPCTQPPPVPGSDGTILWVLDQAPSTAASRSSE